MASVLLGDDKTTSAKYDGMTEILCEPHDYKKFPGLSGDLSTYADAWQGEGWDDIKVNVPDAMGTKILVSQPIVKQYGTPSHTTVIIAQDQVVNNSSEPIEETIELTGTFENSLTVNIEKEMSLEVASEIGGEIEIFSASVSTKLSSTSRTGESQTTSKTVEFKRIINLKVPPQKGFNVKMEAVVTKSKTSVTLPSRIEGPFRIQYPNPTHGHYYWISYISAAAKNDHNKTDMVTIVEQGTCIDVKTVVSDLEKKPLRDNRTKKNTH